MNIFFHKGSLMNNSKKILVIPHDVNFQVRVRAFEIAKRLAKFFDVHYLTYTALPKNTVFAKLSRMRKDFFVETKITIRDGIKLVTTPMMYRPLSMINSFNRKKLTELVTKFKIDAVFNASSMLFPFPENQGVTFIYDVVDDFVGQAPPRLKDFIRNFMRDQMSRADSITACSQSLKQIVKKEFDREAIYLPNGTDLSAMKSCTDTQIKKIRKKHGWEGKYVLGCIGNHGSWSGCKFMAKLALKIKDLWPDAIIAVIGPGEEIEKMSMSNLPDNLQILGAVPPEKIDEYFRAIDLGLLPSEVSAFRNHAFPIKAIEYTAAKKMVVATPLLELLQLKWPNIITVPRDEDTWIKALKNARETEWNPEWSALSPRFDWKIIADELNELITR